MNSKLHQLAEAGQSLWLDSIRRSMFRSGELRALIELGLRGLTSNPTIFEKAIGKGTDYDAQLASLRGTTDNPEQVFEALAVQDIRSACDEFRPLYDQTAAGDGLVSLEVSPLLAHDTAGTVASAKRLWAAVGRPNGGQVQVSADGSHDLLSHGEASFQVLQDPERDSRLLCKRSTAHLPLSSRLHHRGGEAVAFC